MLENILMLVQFFLRVICEKEGRERLRKGRDEGRNEGRGKINR